MVGLMGNPCLGAIHVSLLCAIGLISAAGVGIKPSEL